jgi:superfamily II DNA helicase RecQ
MADKEGVPAYALFTNEQLAEIVRRGAITTTSLREIHGIGESRVEKYGEAVLTLMRTAALPELPSSANAT